MAGEGSMIGNDLPAGGRLAAPATTESISDRPMSSSPPAFAHYPSQIGNGARVAAGAGIRSRKPIRRPSPRRALEKRRRESVPECRRATPSAARNGDFIPRPPRTRAREPYAPRGERPDVVPSSRNSGICPPSRTDNGRIRPSSSNEASQLIIETRYPFNWLLLPMRETSASQIREKHAQLKMDACDSAPTCKCINQ